ncbi:MAG: phosphodiester glycosidase family protein, partial [Lachnospiraceae bacterium]
MKNSNQLTKKIFRGIGWFFAFLFTFVAVLFLTVYLLMMLFCKGPSPAARDTFVATMLETGNMKFVVSWYLTEEEVLAITNNISSTATDNETDTSLIMIAADTTENNTVGTGANGNGTGAGTNGTNGNGNSAGAGGNGDDSGTADNGAGGASGNGNTGAGSASETGTGSTYSSLALINSLEDPDGDGIILVPITGRTFSAQLLVVRDPSKVQLASAYPFSSMEMEKNGYTVGEYANNNNALAAVNAGEFETPSGINWGGRPIGVVVREGNVEFAEPSPGDVLVGFNNNHILVIADVGNMTAEQFRNYVETNQILYGASFKDISDGNTNHFTKLIMNGTPVELNGKGIGANPRTAIGQCVDGTVLILVTDGRGSSGHLGATGQDLINIMMEYGAVNAANLDGGSSSSLYYDG